MRKATKTPDDGASDVSYMGVSDSEFRSLQPSPLAGDQSRPSSPKRSSKPGRAASDETLSFLGLSDGLRSNSPSAFDRPDKESPMVWDEGASYDVAMSDSPGISGNLPNDAANIRQQLKHLQEPKQRWDDGMELEIQQVAAGLAAAMHGDEPAVAAVRVHANDDCQEYVDPLGLGVLNPTSMMLMRGQDVDNGQTARLRKKMDTVRLSTLSPTKKNTINTVVDKLLTTSSTFEPWMYLGRVHSNTSKGELQQGARILEAALQQRTGQLRQLVKENFPRFIGCKSTIDDIHIKLQESETAGTSGSSQLVSDAILAAGEEASHAFTSILERQAEADKVKNKLQLLQRFEALFKMPARVTELAQERNFEQVVSEYRRARALIPRNDHELWDLLFQRVEKNVTSMQAILMAELTDPRVTLEAAITAIHNVELLKAEGLPSAQLSSPLSKLRKAQQRHMAGVLEGMQREHERVLQLVTASESLHLRSNQSGSIWRTLPGEEQTCVNTNLVQDHALSCSNTQLAWLDYLKELSRFYAKHAGMLAELQTSQSLKDLYTKLGHKEEWRTSVKAIRRTITQIMEKVQDTMFGAADKLWKLPDPAMHAHLSALQVLGAAKESVAALHHSLPAVLEMYDSLAMGVLMNGVQSLAKTLSDSRLSTFEWELWRTSSEVSATSASRPVSQAMSTLNHRVCTIMSRFYLLTETARTRCNIMLTDANDIICEAFFQQMVILPAGIAALLDNVAKDSSRELEKHERGGKLFTVQPTGGDLGIDPFANSTALDGEAARHDMYTFHQPMDSPVKALSLLATCAYLADHMVLNLTQLHLPLLCSEEERAKQRCLDRAQGVVDQLSAVKETAHKVYVDMQGALLKASVKHYLTTDGTLWETVPITRNLRNAVFDMVYALVLVMHQVTSHAPAFTQQLMGDLVLIVVTAIEEYMRGDGLRRVGAAGLATFFLEINFIEGTIPKMLKSYAVEEKLDICYENILLRMLAYVRNNKVRDTTVRDHPTLGKVLRDMRYDGTEDEQLKSLHDCLLGLATKVLPGLTQRAQLHTQCFKALQEASLAAEKAGKPSRKRSSAVGAAAGREATRPTHLPANLHAAMDALMKDLAALEPGEEELVLAA